VLGYSPPGTGHSPQTAKGQIRKFGLLYSERPLSGDRTGADRQSTPVGGDHETLALKQPFAG
jgi:hypothetical protein